MNKFIDKKNVTVAEILMHMDPDLDQRNAQGKLAVDIALHKNYRNLANFMLKTHPPPWLMDSRVERRWFEGAEKGDMVKLNSVLQRQPYGFNIDHFTTDKQQTALMISAQHSNLVEFYSFLVNCVF